MLQILNLFREAKGAQTVFSVAVEVMLRICCYVFVIPLEVF